MEDYTTIEHALHLAQRMRSLGEMDAAVFLMKKLNSAHAAGIAYGMAVQEQSQPPEEPAAPQSPTVGEVVADAVAGMVHAGDGLHREAARNRLVNAINGLREND